MPLRATVSAARSAGETRPFAERDIPAVARLHHAAFAPTASTEIARIDRYRAYFTRVFLHNPSRNPALPSLVYQEADGRITGFLGVVPTRMVLNGQHVQAAISSQFVVDPLSQAGFVAVRLAKTFLDGPQDLSISDEANDVTRRLWEALGGTTALLHSIHWTRPLRPAGFVASLLRRRRGLAALAVAARPAAACADTLAAHLRASHLYTSPPRGSLRELDEDALLEQLPAMAGRGSLRPEYDSRSLHWLIERARQRKPDGALHAMLLSIDDQTEGWFLYHLGRDRIADVLQIGATATSIQHVLDAMFFHARERGALAAAGRLEPRFLQALSDNYCLMHRRGPWMLVHARRPELLRCFHGEQAFFTRLDGEWSLGF